MKFFLTTVLAAASLCAVAQVRDNQVGGIDPNAFGPPVQWRTVAEGLNSRIQTGDQRIITNQNDWNKLYASMSGQATAIAPPLADFTRQDLLVFHTGTKTNEGHRIYVQTISRPRVGIKQVEVRIVTPPQGVALPQKLVNPYVIIAVDRAPGNYQIKAVNILGSLPNTIAHGVPNCPYARYSQRGYHQQGHFGHYQGNVFYGGYGGYFYYSSTTVYSGGIVNTNSPGFYGREICPPFGTTHVIGGQGNNNGHTVRRMYNGTIVSSSDDNKNGQGNGTGNGNGNGDGNGDGNRQRKGGG